MKTRCTITLMTALLILTACEATNRYEPLPAPRNTKNCAELNKQVREAKDWMGDVHQRRSDITSNDMIGLVGDFGASNYFAGNRAEQDGKRRIEYLHEKAAETRCTITQ